MGKPFTVKSQIFKTRQSACYREYLKIDGSLLKIEITSDTVDYQSSAKVYVFNLEYKELFSIPYSMMKTKLGLFYEKTLDYSYFSADRDELIDIATEILSRE